MRALVGVLEPAPTTDVIDEDRAEIRGTALNVGDQLLERVASLELQPAATVVGKGANNLEAVPIGLLSDGVGLVLGGVLLVLGRHPHVLRRPDRGFACQGVSMIVVVVSTRQLPRSFSVRAKSLHRCERPQGRLWRAQASHAPRDGIVAGEGRKNVAENGQEVSRRK